MTPAEIQTVVIGALTRIAPEVPPASIQPGVPLREQFDLDSVDFLNFMVALHERLGIEVPEADYAQVATVDRAVAYLAAKLAARAAAASGGTTMVGTERGR